jgi:hypothetical protein
VSDFRPELRFPHFAAESGVAKMKGVGLDNAQQGDILVYNKDVVMRGAAQNWRMPYIAYVTEKDFSDPALKFVRVLAFNNGRYLDACGNNDFWGQGEEYTMYQSDIPKASKLELETLGLAPDIYKNITNEYNKQVDEVIKGTGGVYQPETRPTCDDPGMGFCIENYWNDIPLYFAPDDLRHNTPSTTPLPPA